MVEKVDEVIVSAFVANQVPIAVGRATIAWNNLCYSVYTLFEAVSGLDRETAKATFFSVQSDRSQREMVRALIDNKLMKEQPIKARNALKLIGKIEKVAAKRNDILHIVFVDTHDPDIVKPFHKRGHIKEQEGRDLVQAIHDATIECLDIAKEILSATIEIHRHQNTVRIMTDALLAQSPHKESEKLIAQGGLGLLGSFAAPPRVPEEPGE